MNHKVARRRYPLNLSLTICLVCLALAHAVNAAEVYKWTDANGQVHFSDRMSAPSSGQKIDIKSQPAPEQRTPLPQYQSATPSTMTPVPIQVPKGNSAPVNPSQVPAGCQDLADQIAKVKPGTNWESLAQRFNASCPGIAYECNNYKAHPENSKCQWVKRTGNNMVQTNNYP